MFTIWAKVPQIKRIYYLLKRDQINKYKNNKITQLPEIKGSIGIHSVVIPFVCPGFSGNHLSPGQRTHAQH